MTLLQLISESVEKGNATQTADLVTQALSENYSQGEIIKDGLASGMMKTNKRFTRSEIIDSEVLVAECAMRAGFRVLSNELEKPRTAYLGSVITGTLEGDIRETEKDISVFLMKSLKLKVIDLGASVSNAKFVETALDERADIIACNSSLTIFMPQMKALVQTAYQSGIHRRTKILLSGGPVTEGFCKSIDADLYAQGPIQAAEVAAEFCRKIRGTGTESKD